MQPSIDSSIIFMIAKVEETCVYKQMNRSSKVVCIYNGILAIKKNFCHLQ